MPPPIMKPPETRDSNRVRRAENNSARPAREQRVDGVGHSRDHHEGDAEQRHLRDMIPVHVHELRNEGAEEHQHLGV